MKLILYLFGMALVLYLMIMYTEPLLMMLFFGMCFLLAGCFFMAVLFLLKIRVQLLSAGNVVRTNNALPVIFKIENKTIFPANQLRIRVIYENRLGGHKHRQWVCVYADAVQATRVVLHLESAYCGMIAVSADRVRVTDMLGLFHFTKKISQSVEIPVFPEISDINTEISAKIRDFVGESDIYSKEKSGDDPSEVFDIRQYRPGDRMQQIHWKLTARNDDYMVKEFSRPIGYPVVIFLDFSADKVTEKELPAKMSRVIEGGLSLSLALVNAACYHYLVWCTTDLHMERRVIEKADDMYEQMAALLNAKPHGQIADCRAFYEDMYGADSFCTFLQLGLDLNLLKDGEIYEQVGLDRNTFSGKNYIL